jgi:hypothetical protein
MYDETGNKKPMYRYFPSPISSLLSITPVMERRRGRPLQWAGAAAAIGAAVELTVQGALSAMA